MAEDEQQDSVRADIEAATAELSGTPEPEAVVIEQPVTEPEAKIEEPKADHPTDPTRYLDGTFKKTKVETEQKAPAPKEQPSTDATKVSTEPVSTPADAPPVGWTADAKAEWSKLSPAIKAAVAKRESEISSGGKQWSEEKRRYETALAPVAQSAQRRGMDVGQGLQALVRAQDYLDRDPANAIRWLAQNYGVDLPSLAGAQTQAPNENQPVNIEALVRNAVAPMLAPIQQRFVDEERQRQSSVENLVTDFATSPGHEHFDAVQHELMAMIPAIKSQNPFWTHDQVLQNAYDRAVWANPDTRNALQEKQRMTEQTTRQQEAQQRASKARLASSSVTGRPSGSPVSNEPADSLRDEIMRAMAG